MGENTKIQWCDHTWNGWVGCTKVSPGCAHCYAEVATPSRVFGVEWGPGKARKRTSRSNWRKPLAWDKAAAAAGTRPRVFCASLSDWLDPEVPIEWLADLLALIDATPNLDWLLLTKRPVLWRTRMAGVYGLRRARDGSGAVSGLLLDGLPVSNVWLGTTVENQRRADERIPVLLSIPARVRFLSMEPLLASIDLTRVRRPASAVTVCDFSPANTALGDLDWIIVGGESGPNARPCDVEWIRNVVIDCQAAGVPVFVKQLGSHPAVVSFPAEVAAGWRAESLQPLALRDPKGGDPDEWPDDLRVREFPEVRR